jgi:hypothetical protein
MEEAIKKEDNMDSKTWNICLDYVKKYAVKIETPTGFGTGFFVMQTKIAEILMINIATAYHVVKHAHDWLEPIKITHINTNKTVQLNPHKSENEYEVFFEGDRDVAIIRFQAGILDIREEAPLLTPPKFLLYPGIEIGWCGFPVMAPDTLCFFNGHISAHSISNDYYVDGTVINGVSGAPVFTQALGNTFIIGIVSGYIPNQQMGSTTPGLSIVRNINPIVDAFYPKSTQEIENKT